MQRTYKASGIVYDTDGSSVADLPDALIVTAENEEGVADAISDRTGWCVKSINAIELVIPTSEDLFEEYNQVHAKAEDALTSLLNKRRVTSINVKGYTDNFPMKLVYITHGKNGRPYRTVTLDDGGGQGYDRKTAGDKLLALLMEINAIRYADWDEARKHTAGKDYIAKVLPDRQLHPLLQVPAVDYFGFVTYTLAPLSEETEHLEIDTFLSDHEVGISDVNESPEGTVIVSVEWGDWKHSHAYLDKLMERLGYTKIHEAVTEENGSDCYSSDHHFIKTK